MTPTPPSSNASSAGHSPDTQQYRVVRKRNRVPLSCAPCRHRKLKCNRAHPCDNCTKRSDVGNCTYAAPSVRKKNQPSQGANASPDDMQNRIDRLEGLVLSLMTNGPQAAGPAAAAAAIAGNRVAGSVSGSASDQAVEGENGDRVGEEMNGDESEVDHVTKRMGIMKVDPAGKAFFASEAHWYAILGEITEVKNFFVEHKKQYDEHYRRLKSQGQDENSPGTGFLFRSYNRLTKNEILQQFPPKHVTDLLITRYFNSYYPALHIVHGPTFQKQYDAHWLNPSETSLMWFGLAFSMMALSLQSYQAAGDEPPEFRGRTWEMSKDYRRLTAQTLVEADLMALAPYTIETLILHIQAEYSRSRDAEFGIQLAVSVLVRVAMKMGYHRDSRSFPNITPFQGEMRRRAWSVVRQYDLLFSFQSGLPHIIRPGDTNTALPSNLYDDELHEDLRQLPPSRPDTEITPASFMIATAQRCAIFAEIIETVQVFKCSGYEEIMRLDQRLRELQASTPPHLRMRPMEESARDTSSLIMQRYHLDLLFLRSQVVLHRKFLVPSRIHPRFSYSRRTCIDASMTMLAHQAALHTESRPGGRLRSVKWFTSSLTTNEFLLAGMIICLDLYHSAEAERTGRGADLCDTLNQERRSAMLAAIEQSLNIWTEIKDHSMEAFKAQGTLGVMIAKLKEHQQMKQAAQAYPATAGSQAAGILGGTGLTPGPNQFSPHEDANMAPEQSAAMTLGMLSSGALTPNTAALFNGGGQYGGVGLEPNGPATGTTSSGSTGLTPSWSGSGSTGESKDGSNGPVSAPSPFSALFGGVGSGGAGLGGFDTGMDLGTDWESWDSYVGGGTTAMMDPASMDLSSTLGFAVNPEPAIPGGQAGMSPATTSAAATHRQPANGVNGIYADAGLGAGPFMGVSTPPTTAYWEKRKE